MSIYQNTERLTRDDVVDLAGHIADLADSGASLPSGLRALAGEMPPGPMARTLRGLAERLDAGDSLDDALRSQGGRVPPHLRGMVAAGLRTGRLGEFLGRFVQVERVGAELRRRLWMNLAYPLMLLTALVALIVFLSWTVLRDFESIYKDFGIRMPALTDWLLKVGQLVRDAGWGLVLGPAVLLAAAWMMAQGLPSASLRRRARSALPLIGPLWRWSVLAEFAHMLALLVECDVALPEALPLAGDGVRDRDLAEISRRVAKDVLDGEPLAGSITRRGLFPVGFEKILIWSQAHRSLAEALHMAGETFEARARAQAAFVGVFCTVVVVILVLLGLMFLLPALYLPMIQLISKLSG